MRVQRNGSRARYRSARAGAGGGEVEGSWKATMMLMPPDRMHVAHMARTASELNASDHFASLPALVSPARLLPAHRRPAAAGSLSPTRQTRKRGGRITGSPMRATGGSYDRLAGAMTFAEIAKVGPTSVEALKFSEASAPRKSSTRVAFLRLTVNRRGARRQCSASARPCARAVVSANPLDSTHVQGNAISPGFR